jgi:hypothetical protein
MDEWRQQDPHQGSLAEEVVAIQEVIAAMGQGDRGIAFDEFDDDFRKRHNLPART